MKKKKEIKFMSAVAEDLIKLKFKPTTTLQQLDNYSENIHDAEIIETEYDAEDILATGKIEDVEGEIIVPVEIEIKEIKET